MKLFPLGCAMALWFGTMLLSPAAERHPAPGYVPAATRGLKPSGHLEAAKRINLTIGLPLRNQTALTNWLRELYAPTSSHYRQYLTTEQFTERFGPTKQDYQALIAFVNSNGLAVTHEHPNRVLLDVQGPVSAIEKAFHIQLLTYPHPTEHRSFYAPNVEPTIDSPLSVLHVSGLDDFALPHPAGLRPRPLPIPQAGTGPGGTYLGYDFRKAYAPGVTLTGTGQAVGLLEFDGYYTNDITDYETQAGLPNVPLTNVYLSGFTGTPGLHNDEVALDIELAIAMAPGLSEVIVYEAGPLGSFDSVLNRMATDNLAKQLSSSWTLAGGDDPIANQAFQEFAAQGQSFFNASGDTDAYAGAMPFPVDNPYITVVGGTTLGTAQTGEWASETVWNLNNGQGSGGGISPYYPIPSWQQGVNMLTNHGSATHRNIPDVAIVANGIWARVNNGQGQTYSGTSCAAPLWAAFVALANQQAANYGQPLLGFVNPALYGLGQGPASAPGFHDITTGSNTNGLSPNLFFAVPGYDLCSGWGTPGGQSLIDALAPADNLVISPQPGLSISGLPGGPFSPPAPAFQLTNSGTSTMMWSVANTSIWFNVSPASGSLAPGGSPALVAVAFTSAGLGLPAGSYATTLTFTNQTTGLGRSRQLSLLVAPSLVRNGGFETGDFSNWTLAGNTFFNYVTASRLTPHSGKYAAYMREYGQLGYLSQAVPTSPGQAYLLSFWLEHPNAGTPNQFVVNWNASPDWTNTVFSQADMAPSGWTNVRLVVTASTSTAVLQFGARNDTQFFGLDDVNLVPIPTPSIQLTAQPGADISLSWPALAGLTYQLQFKTNLSQGNWVDLGSPAPATDNTMSTTDPLGTDRQRFYRVVGLP